MWVKQAETDDGVRSGTVSTEAARIAELERENRELRRANQILKSAASFFRSGAVRHEALGVSRGGERPFPLGCRSGLSEAGGSLIWGTPVRVASGPDKGESCWDCQTVRARRARSEGAA
jgi:hypothetical protein